MGENTSSANSRTELREGELMKFRFLLGAVALVQSLAMAMPTTTNAQERVLRAVLDAELQVLDPIASTSYITRSYAYMVYDTLIAVNTKGEYKPQMLESWEVSADGLTYTFKLRPGLKFHDGSAVTSEDCIASIRRWGGRDGLGRRLIAATKELVAVDAMTFRLVLSRPFGLVIEALGKPSSNVPVIMPARLASTEPSRPITEAVGSGPYTFNPATWRQGDRAVFMRNPNYVPRSEPADGLTGGKVAHFDRVEFVSMPDASTRINALLTGDIHYIQRTSPDFIPQLRRNRQIKFTTEPGLAQQMGAVRLNHAQPPFNNPLLRKAFQQLMDQEEFMAGTGLPPDLYMAGCYSMYMCNSPYASDAGAEALRNVSIDRAKQLMREGGYNNEPVVVLQSTDVPVINAIALVTIDRLRRAGFNVVPRAADWSTVAQLRWSKEPADKGGWSLLPIVWFGYDLESPLTHYGIGFNCSDGYPGWSCDERSKTLLEQYVTVSDPVKRREIAFELQARAHDIVSVTLAGQYSSPAAMRADLHDYIDIGIPIFWNVRRQ
ncbi:MAG: ABC transporter substrate-binding protein [Phreatobacter sp.]|uniref:ABC transporter substrate-binding protein n=1 Tax=Phreatobacter sp. TaxID=1966341 RepID=UPI0027373288|nr:ABC transporter substrate-binding protein [Phreatobacter sp.]MDP2801845.1 ABC transporter substrate-binding protein [Phreatobacter sp.]